MENLFLLASRSKFRFRTPSGDISAEDLWDLPLTGSKSNLDDIAKGLNKILKSSTEEQSFVKPATPKSNEDQAKFELVLFVIKTKMEERDAAKTLADKQAKKQKLMALIDQKKDAALSAKSLEELQAEVNAM
jgi:hypothetical protein